MQQSPRPRATLQRHTRTLPAPPSPCAPVRGRAEGTGPSLAKEHIPVIGELLISLKVISKNPSLINKRPVQRFAGEIG